ncbi:MAG: hypothetical protein P8J28_03605, partial [Polaribacter sp.]|nr:hypothetical protein [Polaribacter sp.]
RPIAGANLIQTFNSANIFCVFLFLTNLYYSKMLVTMFYKPKITYKLVNSPHIFNFDDDTIYI